MRSSLFIKLRYLRCSYKSNSSLLNLTIKCQAADFVCVEIFLNLGMFIDHILKEITKGNIQVNYNKSPGCDKMFCLLTIRPYQNCVQG